MLEQGEFNFELKFKHDESDVRTLWNVIFIDLMTFF